jgi:hypothetical protein
MTSIVHLSNARQRKARVYFSRAELSQLMAMYSARVASGDWRDYAIDHSVGMAVFSIFRHAHERPLFAIAKTMTHRGPDYAVFDQHDRVARSTSLAEALSQFDRKIRKLKLVKG